MARTYYHHAAIDSPASSAPEGALIQEPILWKCILLIALTYLVWSEKLSIVLDFSGTSQVESPENRGAQRVKASLVPDLTQGPPAPKVSKPKAQVVLPAGSEGQAVFAIDPGYAGRNSVDPNQVSAAMTTCADYVERFAPVAVAEMQKYGIPASIILAQGLLESNAGTSNLAQQTNNHFGIKCHSNRCKPGHCANFSDDSHKDFFVRYGNVWSSYRAHSNFLKNSRRYGHLFKLDASDYKGWARGLAKAGYATDPKYAQNWSP
ncbi:MAG: glucosaminidase domain-containing protein [Saprospirales bacterium]|nr:glucosaminidase domain-containing protein [Saprospirales bacterium]